MLLWQRGVPNLTSCTHRTSISAIKTEIWFKGGDLPHDTILLCDYVVSCRTRKPHLCDWNVGKRQEAKMSGKSTAFEILHTARLFAW
jgi:hypothetical protein